MLHSHPRSALTHEYPIADLVELCGLAAFIRDSVDDVWIPVTPRRKGSIWSKLNKERLARLLQAG